MESLPTKFSGLFGGLWTRLKEAHAYCVVAKQWLPADGKSMSVVATTPATLPLSKRSPQ